MVNDLELEEKIRNPKRIFDCFKRYENLTNSCKIITIKSSYTDKEYFNKVFSEIREVIIKEFDPFSSYDIAQSIDETTMAPLFLIVFYSN